MLCMESCLLNQFMVIDLFAEINSLRSDDVMQDMYNTNLTFVFKTLIHKSYR